MKIKHFRTLAVKSMILLYMVLCGKNSFGATIYADISQTVIDSNAFVPMQSDGWSVLQTYLHQESDSVVFEVILSYNTTTAINWHSQILIGTVDTSFRPVAPQVVQYHEPSRRWIITFQTDGKCYLELQDGSMAEGSPVIIPIQTKFRK
jgi:hypothetical protein